MRFFRGLLFGIPIGLFLWLILVALYVYAAMFTGWLDDGPMVGTPKEYRYRIGDK